MTLPQSDTVQLACSRHHFNRALLDWTDIKTQTRVTRAYSLLICNLQRTLTAEIALKMDAATINVTLVAVALGLRMAKLATYLSSTGLVSLGRPATGLRTTICVVWNCFHKREVTEE